MARGRRTRGRTFRHNGRSYQWLGFQVADVTIDNTAVDSFLIVPATNSVFEKSRKTVVRTIIQYTLANLDISHGATQTVQALLQKTEIDSTGASKGLINPSSTNAFDLGNADAMWWGQLEVPTITPVLSTAPTMITRTIEAKAKRILNTREHGVSFAVNGGSADALQLKLIIRCLMQH